MHDSSSREDRCTQRRKRRCAFISARPRRYAAPLAAERHHVLARENWSAPSVVVEGYLLAATSTSRRTCRASPRSVSMLSRGTRKRTFAEINEDDRERWRVGWVQPRPSYH
jgi:hypothetical protein